MRPRARQFRTPSKWRKIVFPIVALAAIALAVTLDDRLSHTQRPSDGIEGTVDIRVSGINFRRCGIPPHYDCVIDGDTFYYHDQSIRISGIDAPEINPPECDLEAELGEAASLRLLQLLNGGPFEIEFSGPEDEDQYGRKLRTAVRDGRDFGDILMDEGLARRWAGGTFLGVGNHSPTG